MKQTYGKRLKNLRLEHDVTQEALAEKSKVSIWTIRNHERDVCMISSDELFAYCRALGIPCSSFEGCVVPSKPVKKRPAK